MALLGILPHSVVDENRQLRIFPYLYLQAFHLLYFDRWPTIIVRQFLVESGLNDSEDDLTEAFFNCLYNILDRIALLFSFLARTWFSFAIGSKFFRCLGTI